VIASIRPTHQAIGDVRLTFALCVTSLLTSAASAPTAASAATAPAPPAGVEMDHDLAPREGACAAAPMPVEAPVKGRPYF
jgi:hypothetical protein